MKLNKQTETINYLLKKQKCCFCNLQIGITIALIIKIIINIFRFDSIKVLNAIIIILVILCYIIGIIGIWIGRRSYLKLARIAMLCGVIGSLIYFIWKILSTAGLWIFTIIYPLYVIISICIDLWIIYCISEAIKTMNIVKGPSSDYFYLLFHLTGVLS